MVREETDLLSRAQAGDGEACRGLTESHRREIQVHCSRMLGSTRIALGNTAFGSLPMLAAPPPANGSDLAALGWQLP